MGLKLKIYKQGVKAVMIFPLSTKISLHSHQREEEEEEMGK